MLIDYGLTVNVNQMLEMKNKKIEFPEFPYLMLFLIMNAIALQCESIRTIFLFDNYGATSAIFFGFCVRQFVQFNALQNMRCLNLIYWPAKNRKRNEFRFVDSTKRIVCFERISKFIDFNTNCDKAKTKRFMSISIETRITKTYLRNRFRIGIIFTKTLLTFCKMCTTLSHLFCSTVYAQPTLSLPQPQQPTKKQCLPINLHARHSSTQPNRFQYLFTVNCIEAQCHQRKHHLLFIHTKSEMKMINQTIFLLCVIGINFMH